MKYIALAAALALGGPAIAQDVPQSTSTTSTVDDPKGGYAPAAPLFTTTPPPGATVLFVPSTMTPTEAFPPPAPLARYPLCKRGQYDNCRQRGG
ncbi:MAG: hypothetical protein EOP61_30650 [Sphingomonadales bacterium]|nr:MAG: hypothetical protein EOP61_30650 [Sphingomonadales bacterium]